MYQAAHERLKCQRPPACPAAERTLHRRGRASAMTMATVLTSFLEATLHKIIDLIQLEFRKKLLCNLHISAPRAVNIGSVSFHISMPCFSQNTRDLRNRKERQAILWQCNNSCGSPLTAFQKHLIGPDGTSQGDNKICPCPW